jgi:hypothetical protein
MIKLDKTGLWCDTSVHHGRALERRSKHVKEVVVVYKKKKASYNRNNGLTRFVNTECTVTYEQYSMKRRARTNLNFPAIWNFPEKSVEVPRLEFREKFSIDGLRWENNHRPFIGFNPARSITFKDLIFLYKIYENSKVVYLGHCFQDSKHFSSTFIFLRVFTYYDHINLS